MLTATLVSFGVIFVAELGDKSQLMALTFATRYPGGARADRDHRRDRARPRRLGARRRRARRDDPDPPDHARRRRWRSSPSACGRCAATGSPRRTSGAAAAPARNVVLTVGFVFFLAELGDKTMLATITLATREGLFGTWLGSTIGMVVADALAIGVGRLLGTRLPERTIRIGAAVSFFVFAALLLFEAARWLSVRPGRGGRPSPARQGVDLALRAVDDGGERRQLAERRPGGPAPSRCPRRGPRAPRPRPAQ